MAPHLTSIYVSGWQCSSTASSTNEPGPDFADYPMDTVPNKVDHLVRAQLFHDRRQHNERMQHLLMNGGDHGDNGDNDGGALGNRVDFLTPIVADGDTGHGGLSAVMKLTKLFIEAGAAGECKVEDMNVEMSVCMYECFNSKMQMQMQICCSHQQMTNWTHIHISQEFISKIRNQVPKNVATWEAKSSSRHKNTLIVW